MKIINKRTETTRFDNLAEGSVFTNTGGGVYLKIETTRLYEKENNGWINAVNLEDGVLAYFGSGSYVIPAEAELTIK